MPKTPPDSKMLCYCRNVKYGVVRACILEHDASRVEEVMKNCGAGTGCRTCVPEIEALLEEHRRQRGSFFSRFLRRFLTSKS